MLDNVKTQKKTLLVSYIKNISEKIKHFFNKVQTIHLACKGLNKLCRFIRVLKDKLPLISQSTLYIESIAKIAILHMSTKPEY